MNYYGVKCVYNLKCAVIAHLWWLKVRKYIFAKFDYESCFCACEKWTHVESYNPVTFSKQQ